jgi:AcrR family transcriptional regulator
MTESQAYRQRLEGRMADIAERLISTEGLQAVQARRVAQEADCSVGTLYNVFGGLDGLVIAANTRTLKALGEKLETAARGATAGPLDARLMALALAYRDFAYEQNRRWRALFDHRMEPGRVVPDSYRAQQEGLLMLIERCIAGHIADPGERASAARALFSGVHGIVWLALDNKLGALGPEETERQVRFIVGAAARGLMAGSTGPVAAR